MKIISITFLIPILIGFLFMVAITRLTEVVIGE